MSVFKKSNNYWIDYYAFGKRKREKIGPSKTLAEQFNQSGAYGEDYIFKASDSYKTKRELTVSFIFKPGAYSINPTMASAGGSQQHAGFKVVK